MGSPGVTMRIPLVRPMIQYPGAVGDVWAMHTNGGQQLEILEGRLLKIHGARYDAVHATSSCGTALLLAALQLRVGGYEDVVAPAYCFPGTVAPFLAAGLGVRYVDVDPDLGLVTQGFNGHDVGVAVAMWGNVPDVQQSIPGGPVMLDGAHLDPAVEIDRSFTMVALSFHATKIRPAPEGGALLEFAGTAAKDHGVYRLRNHGIHGGTATWGPAVNAKMSETHAFSAHTAMLYQSPPKVAQHPEIYRDELTGVPWLSEFPVGTSHYFVLRVEKGSPVSAYQLRDALVMRGITARTWWEPPVPRAAAPNAWDIVTHTLQLPCGGGITRDEVVEVARAIREQFGTIRREA